LIMNQSPIFIVAIFLFASCGNQEKSIFDYASAAEYYNLNLQEFQSISQDDTYNYKISYLPKDKIEQISVQKELLYFILEVNEKETQDNDKDSLFQNYLNFHLENDIIIKKNGLIINPLSFINEASSTVTGTHRFFISFEMHELGHEGQYLFNLPEKYFKSKSLKLNISPKLISNLNTVSQ